MASFVGDCFLFLLPSMVLLVLFLTLRLPRVHCWTGLAVRAVSRRLWVIICLILGLPLQNNTSTRAEEAKSIGTKILSGSGQISDEPRLICKPTALAKYLLRHCDSLVKPRLAAWPKGDPHLQTLSSLLWGQHGEALQFIRDNLLLKDGGIIALDWAVGTRMGEAATRKKWDVRKDHQSVVRAPGCFSSATPILLLIPQYWGGMTPHLKVLCQQALCQGFHVVVFHSRGTEGCPLTTARVSEFGDPADLEQAVAYVHSRHPSSMLFAVSEGSGSGVLLSYLGECGSSTYLTAAAAISPVLLGQLWFETPMPPIYHWGALFHRKQQLRRYASSFRGVRDVDRALSSSSLRDFEEALFCSSAQPQVSLLNSGLCSRSHSQWGLASSAAWALDERAYPAKDWESYWERNEPLRDADEVAVPVLCVRSSDDPLLSPPSTLPLSLFMSNPYFFLVLTDKGGHCGFALEDERTVNEEQGGEIWSHISVLEYFRVVAEFLRRDERNRVSWSGLLEENSQASSRGMSMAPPRRRKATEMRRPRPQGPDQSDMDAPEGNFTWKRSYTR